jgi:hypothetical protein
MGSNIIFKCDKDFFNVPKFFSYKDFLFILVIQGTEG